MLEIFQIIFDRRHVKDLRLWVLLMLAIGFGCYHRLVILPIKDRQDRQGKKIHAVIKVAHLQDKIDKELKEENRRPQ